MTKKSSAPNPLHDPKDTTMITAMRNDPTITQLSNQLFNKSCDFRYSYNFTWLGRPIIQYPEDLMAMQEIIWHTEPELIVETGIAHGGSLIFFASLLKLLGHGGKVLGIDVDIREHNRVEIQHHTLADDIEMIEGSSTDDAVIARVHARARGANVMVVLDSNHTHAHVLRELNAYSGLIKKGNYLLVFDTRVEIMPKDHFKDRPWSVGNNPMTAVRRFLSDNDRFVPDEEYNSKLLLSAAPNGYLRCVSDPTG